MPEVTDPKLLALLNGGTAAPSAYPGIIPGRPKAVDPLKLRDQELQEDAAARAARGETRDITKIGTDAGNNAFNQAGKLRDDYNQNVSVKTYETAFPSYMTALQTAPNGAGDLSLITAYAKLTDPTTGVKEGESDNVASSAAYIDATTAKLKGQLDASGGVFSDEQRQRLRGELSTRLAAYNDAYNTERLRYKADAEHYGLDPDRVIGPHLGAASEGKIETLLNTSASDGTIAPLMRGGLPVGSNIEFGMDKGAPEPFDRAAFLKDNAGITPDQETSLVAFWNANMGNKGITPGGVARYYAQIGVPVPDAGYLGQLIKNAQEGKRGFGPADTSGAKNEYEARLQGMLDHDQKVLGREGAGMNDLAQQGMSGGLTDEAAGLGGAIAGALTGDANMVGNYQLNRDAERLRLNQGRERLGGFGTAAEITGGIAGMPGRNIIGPSLPVTVGGAARSGALASGIGGFGYGEGPVGSVTSALAGVGAGGLLGAGGAKLGGVLSGIGNNRAAGSSVLSTKASELEAAGAAEGVTVNRAMVDPALANRVSGVDASIAGGPRVQGAMSKIEGQIEGRVGTLGQNGRALDAVPGGDMVQGAGERFIAKSGKAAKVKYDRAERLAGDAKVQPEESLRRVDNMISQLSETPDTNAAEIGFLQKIKNDLGSDLSVGALRRMRTSLRKRISSGELTFGEDEARVLDIMDGAADDIRAGLIKQGKGDAANAFDSADKSYRARMDFIKSTVQPLLGKRGSNTPPNRSWERFAALAKDGGDTRSLRKFYATLTPDEAQDVAATFANDLGKNNAGDFSVSHFISQSEKLDDSALRTIFGPQGAQSIKNLRVLGKEVKRVTGVMNSRTSKTAVANNYRDWLTNAMLGAVAGGGGAIGGGTAAGLGGAAVAVGVKAGRDILTANALMSPKLTQWIASAPRTSSAAAINAHFAKLGAIAKAEPALAGDIDILRDAVMKAANDNAVVTRSAAKDEDSDK